jgi:predicted phage terminase large subunit-like protein
MDMPRTVDAIRGMSEQWPQAAAKLVEDRANGPAVIATLRHEIGGLIAVNPEGGKIARAAAASPQIESHNVYLPHPAIAPWVEDLIEECAAFSYATHDDQVDALTQALNRLQGASRAIYPILESEIAIDPIQIPRTGRASLRWMLGLRRLRHYGVLSIPQPTFCMCIANTAKQRRACHSRSRNWVPR